MYPIKRIKQSPLLRRLVSGTFWVMTGTVLARTVGLVSALFVARFLGRSAYGEIGIVLSTITMFQIMATLSLGATANRNIAWHRSQSPERVPGIIFIALTSTIIAATLSGLLLAKISHWLAINNLAAPHLAPMLRLAAISLFCLSLKSCIIGILSGFEEFSTVSKLTVLTNVINTPLMIAGAWLWGVWGYFFGLAIGYCLGAVVHIMLLIRILSYHDITGKHCISAPRECKILLHYTLPAVLAGALVTPTLWYCKTLLVRQPGGYAAMGSFSAAYQILSPVILIATTLTQSSSPILANLWGRRQIQGFLKVLLTVFVSSIGIVVVFGGGIALFASWIISAFGREFQADHRILYYMAVLAILQTADGIQNRVFAATGKMWEALSLALIWTAVVLFFCHYLIPTHLATGLAGGMAIAYGVRVAFSGGFIALYTLSLKRKSKRLQPSLYR